MSCKEYAYRPSQAHLKRVKTADGRMVINKAYSSKAARVFKETGETPATGKSIMQQFTEHPKSTDALTGNIDAPFNADVISQLDDRELNKLGLKRDGDGYYYMNDRVSGDNDVNFFVGGRKVYRANLNNDMQPTNFINPVGQLMPAVRAVEINGYHETSFFMNDGKLNNRENGLPAVSGPELTEYWDNGKRVNGPGGVHRINKQVSDDDI